LQVRQESDRVRIYSRNGADFTARFPRIVDAVRRMKVRSVVLDGEGIVYDEKGMPSFDREVSLVAFDLLELDGEDFRKRHLLDRKARLAKLVARLKGGIEFNEHIEGDGAARRRLEETPVSY
jgi:bifunctional non-homologous end joining protein LigD